MRQVVVDLLVRGIEVASEQGQNLLTATASLYLAYMSAMWVWRIGVGVWLGCEDVGMGWIWGCCWVEI